MASESGHRYKQTPIRFTPEDESRISDLIARHPNDLGGPRTVAEIVRLALKRWHDESVATIRAVREILGKRENSGKTQRKKS